MGVFDALYWKMIVNNERQTLKFYFSMIELDRKRKKAAEKSPSIYIYCTLAKLEVNMK